MNVWLITIGEPLPVDPGNQRLLRAGLIAESLAARGHQTTWWTSTFDHWQKAHRFNRDRTVTVSPNYQIQLLHGSGYGSNVSFSRIADHWLLGRKFRLTSRIMREQPDVILCSFPAIELSLEAVRFGTERRIPVILDIRDLWPDIFVKLVPRQWQAIARSALIPYYRMVRRSMKDASAIFAINEPFLNWGLMQAERAHSPHDHVFPLAYPATVPAQPEQEAAEAFWQTLGIGTDPSQFIAVFAGTVGRQFEFEPVVDAARQLRDVRFVICGTGDRLQHVQSLARDVPNVIFTGWVGAAEIWTLLRHAHAGLAPYHSEESFTASLPNKSLEYLSAGLPVISSLSGALEQLLASECCGITYPNKDARSLAAAIRRLQDEPDLRKKMSQSASHVYSTRFRADAVYGRLVEALEQIVAKAITPLPLHNR